MTGVIKWFSQEKKFGFITMSGGADVFFHISGVLPKTQLEEGNTVQFELIDSPKGKKAVNVGNSNG